MSAASDRRVARWVGIGLILALAVKAALAARFSLFGDEAFYWQCAQRMDVAYADHPFMTALLVRIGTEALGPTPFGVRWPFVLLGAGFLAALHALARPLVGRRDAWLAVALAMVVPITAVVGTLAIPDAPLLFFITVGLAALERATRSGRPAAWIVTGLAAGAGFATHYRFALFPIAALVYLLGSPNGRACLRTRGPWIALGLMLVGVVPILLFNLRLDFAPLLYQGVERHAAFRADRIAAHFVQQISAVTPFIYGACLLVLVRLVYRARRGDDRAFLFASFALVPLSVFALASPWADPRHLQVHWPAPGYLPLLALLPHEIARAAASASRARRAWLWALPASSALLLLLAGALFATGLGPGADMRRAFTGWDEVVREAELGLARVEFAGLERPVLVGDNFVLAAELDFRLRPRADVYVLDHRRNRAYGRALQYRIFERDESALRARPGEDALVIVESSWLGAREGGIWLEHVRSLFERLDAVGELTTPAGRKERQFLLFVGHGIRPEANPTADEAHS